MGLGAGLVIAVSSDAGRLCRRLQLCLPHTWLPLAEAAGGDEASARGGGEVWGAAKQQPHTSAKQASFGLVCISASDLNVTSGARQPLLALQRGWREGAGGGRSRREGGHLGSR